MKWSYSVHTTMRRCQRQLMFGHSMASHAARDPQRREAYLLKQLQHVSAWQGSLVHQVLATRFLEENIRARLPVDPAALAQSAQDLARRQFAFSAAGRYREAGQTKGQAGDEYCALFEHEYGWPIPADALPEIYTNLARCFDNLASQHELLSLIRSGHDHRSELRLSIRLTEHLPTVTATLDLAFMAPDGQPVVVDWKVADSETSDYSRQLLVYALAVVRGGPWRNVTPDGIRLYEVNLLRNYVRQHAVTADRLDDTEDFVYRSLVEQQSLVGDHKYGDLDLSEFEVAERPATCTHCNFRKLCIPQLAAMNHPAEVVPIQGRLC